MSACDFGHLGEMSWSVPVDIAIGETLHNFFCCQFIAIGKETLIVKVFSKLVRNLRRSQQEAGNFAQ